MARETPEGIEICDGDVADKLIEQYAPKSHDIDVAICAMGEEIDRLREENERLKSIVKRLSLDFIMEKRCTKQKQQR